MCNVCAITFNWDINSLGWSRTQWSRVFIIPFARWQFYCSHESFARLFRWWWSLWNHWSRLSTSQYFKSETSDSRRNEHSFFSFVKNNYEISPVSISCEWNVNVMAAYIDLPLRNTNKWRCCSHGGTVHRMSKATIAFCECSISWDTWPQYTNCMMRAIIAVNLLTTHTRMRARKSNEREEKKTTSFRQWINSDEKRWHTISINWQIYLYIVNLHCAAPELKHTRPHCACSNGATVECTHDDNRQWRRNVHFTNVADSRAQHRAQIRKAASEKKHERNRKRKYVYALNFVLELFTITVIENRHRASVADDFCLLARFLCLCVCVCKRKCIKISEIFPLKRCAPAQKRHSTDLVWRIHLYSECAVHRAMSESRRWWKRVQRKERALHFPNRDSRSFART